MRSSLQKPSRAVEVATRAAQRDQASQVSRPQVAAEPPIRPLAVVDLLQQDSLALPQTHVSLAVGPTGIGLKGRLGHPRDEACSRTPALPAILHGGGVHHRIKLAIEPHPLIGPYHQVSLVSGVGGKLGQAQRSDHAATLQKPAHLLVVDEPRLLLLMLSHRPCLLLRLQRSLRLRRSLRCCMRWLSRLRLKLQQLGLLLLLLLLRLRLSLLLLG
mmetsp:Transcript_43606/g.130269  ORF Transcript_43606/g.130269 Transcript_43606/m.130269 type:complete len:215 (-) Transcript_43606:1261-1905(-)